MQEVLRDTQARGARATLDVSAIEKMDWKKEAIAFLAECRQAQASGDADDQAELSKKVARLASFYMLHSSEWQLLSCGLGGYTTFYAENTPDTTPYEKRRLIVECQDSYSVNCAKAHFLLNKRSTRLLPMWDVIHKRHNMKLNSYKRSGLWPSIKLQMTVFEVLRGPWGNYKFWGQLKEATRSYLSLIDESDPIWQDEFPSICEARQPPLDPAVASPKEILDDMREDNGWRFFQTRPVQADGAALRKRSVSGSPFFLSAFARQGTWELSKAGTNALKTWL